MKTVFLILLASACCALGQFNFMDPALTTVYSVTPPPATWSPTNVSGLWLWLDSSVEVTNSSGVTPPSDGDLVNGWGDRSGLGNSMITRIGTVTYIASAFHGFPAISAQINSQFRRDSFTGLSTNYSIFTLMRSPTNNTQYVVRMGNISGQQFEVATHTASRIAQFWEGPGNTYATCPNWDTNNMFNAFAWISSADPTNGMYFNGSRLTITAGATYKPSAPPTGALYIPFTVAAYIDYIEVIGYDHALDDTSISNVFQYFQSKYGAFP